MQHSYQEIKALLSYNLYYLIEKISNLTGDKTLFLIDDIIADETPDKCRQPLLELEISGLQHSYQEITGLL